MDNDLKQKLMRIITDLPSENATIDYKINESYSDDMGEYVNDLCGFLNSIDGYGKDKFIILGISAKQRKIIGLSGKPLMQDDNQYQLFADKIEPRPTVETGIFPYNENGRDYYIGYIYIPASNTDRIYSICKNYLVGEVTTKTKLYASTAFIRRGSKNDYLTEYDRRKIYELDRETKQKYSSLVSNYYDISKVDMNNNILKMCVLVGGWDETNENDKNLVSEIIGLPYDNWIASLRLMIKEENSPLVYKNEKWKVEDRLSLLQSFASSYFKDEIQKFQVKAIEVLSQVNPKFELESDQRMMADLYGKKPKYSELLKQSIAESLPMITSIEKDFINCGNSAKYLSWYVVNDVLKSDDWRVWASIENVLPLLAESQPDIFLKEIEDKLLNKSTMMQTLLTSSEVWITNNHYTAGLYWALQLIAWEERYLVRVCVILSKLSNYDKKAMEQIEGILLPWYPQTKASIEVRKSAIENVIKENEDCGWKIVIELMPQRKTIGMPSYKPKWNNIISEDENNKVMQIDYWKQIENYLDILIKYSKEDVDKLSDLIDLLDDVPEIMFNKIISKLSENRINKMSEEKRYVLWNHLEDFITRHIKFSESDWSLKSETLNTVKLLSSGLKPTSILIYNKRYFRRDAWELYDERGDYKESEKKLNNLRLKITKEIYSLGFDIFINFVKSIEDTYVIGICLAEFIDNLEVENQILNYLDSKNVDLTLFAQGFVYKKHILFGYDWLKRFDISKWSINKKTNLLTVLPANQTTWDLVSNYLGKKETKYWKCVNIRFIDNASDINYPIKKLIENGRPVTALDIINLKLYDKQDNDYDRNLAVEALESLLNKQDEIKHIDTYHIKMIIKDLQKSSVSKDKLFHIEWAYLAMLNDDECRAITIEKELSENPKVYNDIICLAYKAHSVSKEDAEFPDAKIATNAYRLLHQWKMPPGLEVNKTINKKKLNDWYEEMKKLCTESDRLEVGLLNFGHVLYHSPSDKKSSLWIDKNVAEILNAEDSSTIREGFRTEAFNSRGVISIDAEGKVFDNIASDYDAKAETIEKAGYHRIAIIMRSLADSYKEQAERERERDRYSNDD